MKVETLFRIPEIESIILSSNQQPEYIMFSVIIEFNPHNSRKININRFVLQENRILLGGCLPVKNYR